MIEVVVNENGVEAGRHKADAIVVVGENALDGFVSLAGEISIPRLASFVANLEAQAIQSVETHLLPIVAEKSGITDEVELRRLKRKLVDEFYTMLKNVREETAKNQKRD